jgi:predicted nucleic acid-binding protein
VKKEIVRELMEFNILDYTWGEAFQSAKLEVELEKIGKPVGRFDTMIATICIERDAMLSTLNRTHFEKFVEFGLRLFNV